MNESNTVQVPTGATTPGLTHVDVVDTRAKASPKAKPAPKAPAKKAAPAPKAKSAPAPKAKAAAPAKEAKEKVDRSMSEDHPTVRRMKLVKMLRKLGATTATAATPLTTLVEKLGYTRFDVYGLVSGSSGKAGSSPRCLMATGHAKIVDGVEGGKAVYLTAKGVKTDFTESPFSKPTAPVAKKAAK